MNHANRMTCWGGIAAVALCAAVAAFAPGGLHADEDKAMIVQVTFSSPDEAVSALKSAAKAHDLGAMRSLFGPQFEQLLTGDPVQDANGARKFATAMAEGCRQVSDGPGKVTLEIGTNNWPMPIPLVKADDQWFFDTAAGKQEILNRHIGRDELTAIGVCRQFVTAQKDYSRMNPEGGATPQFARKFRSTPGKKDGLYWPATQGEPVSPFGPLVAEAQAEGYTHKSGSGPHAFHGYYFRILTQQGEAAPGGKKDYLHNGELTGGFALIAYPAFWDRSGVMTFMVNQDGRIYERDFGPRTLRIASAIQEYNPDRGWKPVQDEGVANAALEK